MFYIKDSENENASQYTIGGKAGNLYKLKGWGLQVPKWIVIPAENLETLILECGSNKELWKKKTNTFDIPDSMLKEITAYFNPDTFFAVRSSAIDEDSPMHSFAGQFETYLFVTLHELADAIKKIWLSTASDRVCAYREKNNLPLQFAIAVIIQEMIPSDLSGVAFGMNPVNGSRSEQIINAVYGIGEGLVSGELTADQYTVSLKEIHKEIALKKEKFIFNISEQKGTKLIEVETELQKKAVLSDEQIYHVSNVLTKLKQKTGKYQDIEFAFYMDQFYLLQARPITSLSQVADKESAYIVWDNSNIIESYPGLTLPLTFSFITGVYEGAYRQFLAIMGVNQSDIEKEAQTLENMLGLIKGRVYYNLRSWYQLLALLPGYSLNASFMEKMMGVKERFELENRPKHSKTVDYLRILKMLTLMLQSLYTLPKQKRKFEEHFNKNYEIYDKKDLDSLPADKLVRMYFEFEKMMLSKWKAPLVNDFFAMIFFGSLQKFTQKYIGSETSIHNDLISDAKDIISTEPALLIIETVEKIKKDASHVQLFANHPEDYIYEQLQTELHTELKLLIDKYINKYGDRYVGELKLETITYKQNPELYIKVLKSYVISEFEQRRQNLDFRKTAEKKMRAVLKRRPLQQIIYKMLLKHSRTLVSNRENLRFYRTRGFGMVRRIFIALGKQFYSEGILEHERDIFYLKKEEIFDFVMGKSPDIDMKQIVQMRKEQYLEFTKAEVPAERVVTYGIVNHANKFTPAVVESIANSDLKGIGCCPGTIKARVQVVSDPNEIVSLEGDILVTSSTDPGWVTLFPSAGGILVERGSLLSHSAIVSREMGIPCIVGITGILGTLKTGMIVEMDGSTGLVKIL